MNRQMIKEEAKELCRTSRPSPVVMGLLFTVLTAVITGLSTRVLSSNITMDGASRYLYAFNNGNYERMIELIDEFTPTRFASLLSTVLTVVKWIVGAGFSIFILNTVRKTGAVYGNLLDGFASILRILLLYFLEGLIIGLFSLLLVFPGIIVSYSYRQALFLVLDHPELSVIKCMKTSRKMMKGHKGELFVMDLSFIGWRILCAFLAPVNIWVAPYTQTAYVLFYESLTQTGDNSYRAFN